MIEGKILSKDEYSTVVITDNREYTISQSPSKGIEVMIESRKPPRDRPIDELTVRFWIPVGTESPPMVTFDTNEVAIYPVPKKVLEDLQERTKGDLKIEDVAEEAGEEPGKEFYMRTKGYILMGTI